MPWSRGTAVLAAVPKAVPSIAPINSDGANTPPEPPEPMVSETARILATTSKQQPEPKIAAERLRHGRVANAEHLRQEHPEQTEGQPPGTGLRYSGMRMASKASSNQYSVRVKPIPTAPATTARSAYRPSSPTLTRSIRRHRKRRHVAESGPTDDRRSDAGDDDDAERARVEFAQDDFQGEEHTGDRRVERRGDAACCTASDQRPNPIVGHAKRLADRRTQGRTDLDDGPSRPTDPPEPIHSAEASALTTTTAGRIRRRAEPLPA